MEGYRVFTRYILEYQRNSGCQRDHDSSAKTGYAGSSIPSVWLVLVAWTWGCRVRCLEMRGNHFPGTSSMAAMYGMWDGANMASASGMSLPLLV